MAEPSGGGVVQSTTAGSSSLTIDYDAASSSYTLTGSAGSEAFLPSDRSPSSTSGHVIYDKSDGAQLDLFTTSPPSGKARSYVAMGVWRQTQANGAAQDTTFETFVFGNASQNVSVPRTGEASYDVDMVGYFSAPGGDVKSLVGPGVFEADFLSGQFKADIYPQVTDLTTSTGYSGGGVQLIAVGSLSASDGSFAGTAAFQDSINGYYVGPISGRLYGPSAQEVGAEFTGDNPNGGALTGALFGAQSGHAPDENLTLTNIYAQQLFSAIGVELSTNANVSGGFNTASTYMMNGQLTVQPGGVPFSYSPGLSNLQYATYTAADVTSPDRANFTTYQTTVSGVPLQFDLYNVGAGNSELALTYMELGVWRQGTGIPPANDEDLVYSVYGIATPAGQLSRLTGTAQYSGVVYGDAVDSAQAIRYDVAGSSSFSVNFSAQTLAGGLTLNGTAIGGASRNFGSFNFSGPVGLNGNTYALSQGGAGVGQMESLFYGPAAQEVGGPFAIQLNDGTVIAGATAAKRN